MNSKYYARMSMFEAVALYCKQNNTIISTLPALTAQVDTFNSLMDGLKELTQKYDTPTKGITFVKAERKQKLVESVLSHAAAIYAFARNTKNGELQEKVKLSRAKTQKMGSGVLDSLARQIQSLSNAYVSQLGDYGITTAGITELDTLHKAFAEVSGAPKAARASRRETLELITEKQNEINQKLMGEIDPLVASLVKTYPGFVAGYESARGIDNSHTYITRTGGTVKKADNTPAAGAKVELLEAGTGVVKYSTITDASGTFAIKGLKTGAYDVKVQYNGNPEPTVLKGVEIQRRKANKLEVVIQ